MEKYDLIVIGGGPAGLTSAIYGARYGLKTLVIEKTAIGGQLAATYEIENYPGFLKISGFDLAMNMHKQAESLGVNFIFGNINNIDLNKKSIELNNGIYIADALILCLGASERKLGLENEEKLTGSGISYCAVCDANFYKDKDVVVFGTGNSAVESAVYLSNVVKSVTLISKYGELKAHEPIKNSLNNIKNIKIIYNYLPVKIYGDTSVVGVDIMDNENKSIQHIKCDGIFVSIGRIPDTSLVKNQLTMFGNYIVTDEEMKTNIDGIFVAGDIRKKTLRQVITACSDGAIAATSALKYIIKNRNN